MAMVARGPDKLGRFGKPVRGGELDDPRQVPCRHSLEYLDGGGFEREHTRGAGRERQITCGLRGHGGHQLDAAHVGPNVHAGAAVLDRHAGHPALEDVARGRWERLTAYEDVGWRDRDDGRPGAVGHDYQVDAADAHTLHAIAHGKLDTKQILRRDWREAAVRERANIVGPAVRVFELVRGDADGEGTRGSPGRERAVQRTRRGPVTPANLFRVELPAI